MPRDKFGKIILIRIPILYHSNQVECHVPHLLTYSVTITILCHNRRIQHLTVSPEQVDNEMASHMTSIGFPALLQCSRLWGARKNAAAEQTHSPTSRFSQGDLSIQKSGSYAIKQPLDDPDGPRILHSKRTFSSKRTEDRPAEP